MPVVGLWTALRTNVVLDYLDEHVGDRKMGTPQDKQLAAHEIALVLNERFPESNRDSKQVANHIKYLWTRHRKDRYQKRDFAQLFLQGLEALDAHCNRELLLSRGDDKGLVYPKSKALLGNRGTADARRDAPSLSEGVGSEQGPATPEKSRIRSLGTRVVRLIPPHGTLFRRHPLCPERRHTLLEPRRPRKPYLRSPMVQ